MISTTSINNLTDLESAIKRSAKLKAAYLLKRKSLQAQLDNAETDTTDYAGRIAELTDSIETLQFGLANSPSTEEAMTLQEMLANAFAELKTLENHVKNYGKLSLESREAQIDMYNVCIRKLLDYDAELEAKRPTLSAAA